MPRTAILLFIHSLLCAFHTKAQPFIKPVQLLVQEPVEKLYLQTDRERYYSGETIWIKGYFMSDYRPSLRSTTLYVELLNEHNEVILKNIFPVYAGTVPGQLELPPDLPSGAYQLRAYSPGMSGKQGFPFSKIILIDGKESGPAAKETEAEMHFTFFPEGGNFITGASNVLAFKYTNAQGLPLAVSGVIKNSKDEIITRFKSVHDGMGKCVIVPQKGETYHAVIDGVEAKYFLPQQTTNGIVLNVTSDHENKRFRIVAPGDNELFKPRYMIGQMQNEVLFTQNLQSDKQVITGSINTKDFYSGILHLTVFNKDSMPLAERITFVDNKEYIVPAVLQCDTLDNGKWARNQLSIMLQDTVAGDFSVSITDADFTGEQRPSNIYSEFLLTSDIRGYVHQPAYYFGKGGDSVTTPLDLLMMTNGWTRFKWTDSVNKKPQQTKKLQPHYIKLAGTIFIEGTQKPLADKDIIMFISPAEANKIQESTPRMFRTDHTGHFEIDSVFFYGKTRLLFSEVRGKKNKFIEVRLDSDSLNRKYPVFLKPLPFQYAQAAEAIGDKMRSDYKKYLNEKGIVLEHITIKAKQKSSIEKLDETYANPPFSGNIYSRRLDLRNENYAGDIFEYLRNRVPGLRVSGEPGNYVLNYRGGTLSYYLDMDSPDNKGNVMLFLDDNPTNAMALETVLMSDIAFVKLFATSIAAPGGGAAMVVYTKKGADKELPSFARTGVISYQGYTIVKEFYTPEYKLRQGDEADKRITLHWLPAVFSAGVNLRIPLTFYNNARTKRFKVVAEGITADGRMLMLEKIIEPGK